jgi:class 3 adenylate cyclase
VVPGRDVDAAAHLARVAKTSERRQATVLFADISGFTAMSGEARSGDRSPRS